MTDATIKTDCLALGVAGDMPLDEVTNFAIRTSEGGRWVGTAVEVAEGKRTLAARSWLSADMTDEPESDVEASLTTEV